MHTSIRVDIRWVNLYFLRQVIFSVCMFVCLLMKIASYLEEYFTRLFSNDVTANKVILFMLVVLILTYFFYYLGVGVEIVLFLLGS